MTALPGRWRPALTWSAGWTVLVGLACLLSGCATPERTVPAFLDDFITVATGSEDPSATRGEVISRWRQDRPISYALYDETPGDRESVERSLAKIAAETGLTFRHDPARPMIRVFFFEDHYLLRAAVDRLRRQQNKPPFPALCFGAFALDRQGYIVRAVVFLVQREDVVFDCADEELAQTMGLPNDADDNYGSIFNDRSLEEALTDKDRCMLRVLYSDRLHPGMTPPDIRRALAGYPFEACAFFQKPS